MIEAYLASIVEEERRLNAADAVGVPVDRVTVGDLLDLDQTKVAGAAVPANSSAELLSPREGGAATKAPEDDARFFLASDVRSEVLAIYNRAAANLRATKQAANTYAGTGFKHKEGGREGPGGGPHARPLIVLDRDHATLACVDRSRLEVLAWAHPADALAGLLQGLRLDKFGTEPTRHVHETAGPAAHMGVSSPCRVRIRDTRRERAARQRGRPAPAASAFP